MAVYANSSREICVGDRVRGTYGVIAGRTGTVVTRSHWGYDCGVEWDDWTGGHDLCGAIPNGSRSGLYVSACEIEYIGDEIPVADGVIRCSRCGAEVDASSKLGKRLYKNARICPRCIAGDIGTVHGYHFAKNLRYDITGGKITLGTEVEIDAPGGWGCDFDESSGSDLAGDCVEYAKNNNYALLMSYEHDGSLREGGVECVGAPLTIDEWKSDEVRKQYEFLFNRADEYGFDFDADNHAGLHIHIGRKDLCGDNRDVSDAVGLLMGWACTRLWDSGLCEVAGREANEYCRPYNESEYGDEKGGNGLKDTDAVYNRYHFVNIQNSKTLELRVFNRATSYEDIIVAVDMCYMLGKWATKKINAFLKRGSYSAKAYDFTDALGYADRITWDALIKYSKFPEITLPRLRDAGVAV